MVIRFIKRNPFLFLVSFGLAFNAMGYLLNVQYDSAGLRGLVYWAGALLAIPFIMSGEFIHSFFIVGRSYDYSDEWTAYHTVAAYVMGFCFCIGMDYLLRKTILRIRFARDKATETEEQH